jgi:prenyl protein peptidase
MNFEHLSLLFSIFVCLFMASFYVISLYLWSHQNRFNRNDPQIIKRRFISVILTSLLSVFLVNQLSNQNIDRPDLLEWIGFRFDMVNLFKSILFTLFLTLLLFLGPIVQHSTSNYLSSLNMKLYEQPNNSKINDLNTFQNFFSHLKSELNEFFSFFEREKLKKNFSDYCFLRNYIVSPFTEEFVFRSCMLPLLVHNLGLIKSIFLTPLFFGLAHLHHIVEGLMNKEAPFKYLFAQHMFQFTYTYIFGVYSSYIFLRTGNFFASFLNHSFCNYMGFPNFGELIHELEGKTRKLLIIAYLTGFVTFFTLLNYATSPIYFDNRVFVKYF